MGAATTPRAGVSTPVAVAADPNPVPHAQSAVLRASGLLKPHAWARLLSCHPDQSYAKQLNQYIRHGVPILYDGPEFSRVCPNWGSTQKFHAEVTKIIREDLSLGRKSGPYSTPPCNLSLRYSPATRGRPAECRPRPT